MGAGHWLAGGQLSKKAVRGAGRGHRAPPDFVRECSGEKQTGGRGLSSCLTQGQERIETTAICLLVTLWKLPALLFLGLFSLCRMNCSKRSRPLRIF